MTKKTKKPWPTKKAMAQIYDKHLWGGHDYDFFSGEGSHNPEITQPYLSAVVNFLSSFKEPIDICDLGCGDFNIGSQLLNYSKKYHAIDIVDALIERNKMLYLSDNLEFHCLDISKDDLPKADCIILKQVLQHLSNKEIHQILKKLQSYKYLILTEHIPNEDYIPNLDIISGQGIRLKRKSGVNILETPFNFKVETSEILSEYTLAGDQEKIVTTLFRLF